jgi:serine/threonine protein kinase
VVMELVDGQSLDDLVESGPLAWPTAVAICADVASALAAVHARGLVHRDIKPANVLLTERGAKVVDFGISAIAGDQADHAGEDLLGTPAYLAPERLDGAPTAPATDVYALGLLLYKTLTGRLPWDADTPAKMLSAHRYRKPAPLPPIEGLPPGIADLCLRCLAKPPADRPSAEEVAGQLYLALQDTPAPVRQKAAKARLSRPVRAGAAAAGVLAGVLVFFTSCGNDAVPSAGNAPTVVHEPGSGVGTLVGKVLASGPATTVAQGVSQNGTAPRKVTPPQKAGPPDAPDGKPDKGKDKDKPKKHDKD